MSDFDSGFWSVWIVAITLGGIAFCVYLLWSQGRAHNVSGEVTGHVWDENLEEYNNPLPNWWRWLFYLTIFFALGYLAMYPGLGTYAGSDKWTAIKQYETEKAAADAQFKQAYGGLLQQNIELVANDPKAHEAGERLFLNYCAQCHGSDAKGAKGFPNLTDNDWLWGGQPEKIKETITLGRMAVMPSFAHLGEDKIKDVARYVGALSGQISMDSADVVRGKEVFATAGCTACHGAEGKGNVGLAPNLTDKVWLYGGRNATIIETITKGRNNAMPAFGEFLGEDKVHLLAAYVYSLNAGKGTATEAPSK
ncbi:MAG TPA: cytochrome-c oxidase, cbb3-type subunit III [Rhodocyclaceae bacterium]|nr:cytochrome-c oxidase, cbb3-type subunit III [Rhodocyclaceae bacterium]